MSDNNDERTVGYWVYQIWKWITSNGANPVGTLVVQGSTTAPVVAVTVRQETYLTVLNGELAGSANAIQMPQRACRFVKFIAATDNAGNVYIGGAGVTVANGTTDTTTGLVLDAGQDSGWIPVADLNQFYRICDNAGDDLTYMALV